MMPAISTSTISDVERAFASPPDDSRIMMRWWWFGPAVEEDQLLAEMKAMKAAGIGGFEVAVLYPLTLDHPERGIRNYPYMSETFLDRIRFVSRMARELGLRMDVTIGSGWSYGGPHITPELAAARLRSDIREIVGRQNAIGRPVPYDNERLVAALIGRGSKQEMPHEYEMLDISGDGPIPIPAGDGPRIVAFYFSSKTGQAVKRAAVGAEGYVLDHINRAAIERHLEEVGDKILDAAEPGSIHAIFCDSLEVYEANWTEDMLAEFKKRRGYDIAPFLPFLEFEAGNRYTEIRRDFGRTISELYEENFLVPMREWAERRRVLFRMQNYGMPPTTLASHKHLHLIEGESWGWPGLPETKWASSAAHLLDVPVTSSETWTWAHSPSFRATPLDLKGEADQHFLLGINQLIGHGWPYSPAHAGEPGWALYAAAALSNRNPWWPVMPDLAAYLHRVSYVLRQGKPRAEVALYAPSEDAWGAFKPGERAYLNLWKQIQNYIGPAVFEAIGQAGHDFDLFDDGTLAEAAAKRYSCVILPRVRFMPEATRAWLKEFAANGGVIIAVSRAPQGDWPGLDVVEVSELAARLSWQVSPSLSLSEKAPAVGFVRRQLTDADIYFIANTGNTPVETNARFTSDFGNIEVWDPMRGGIAPVTGNSVALHLEPYGSTIVVLRKDSGSRGGRTRRSVKRTTDLRGEWQVEAGSYRESTTLPHSWADNTDTRHYSGAVRYRTFLDLGQDHAPGDRILLDFGDAPPSQREMVGGAPLRGKSYAALVSPPIRDAATIYVNGKPIGSLWAPPYRIDVTDAWQKGRNEIVVEVYNTAINLLSEGGRLPDVAALTERYGQRARIQDMDNIAPLPSGLLSIPRIVLER
jgi:alpha-L-rhamnosidase